MAGKESRSRGSGRGLNLDKTGLSGADGRGVRGDEHEGGASSDVGVGVTESLGRFEGRRSRSSPWGIGSAAISEGEVGESASSGTSRCPWRDRFRLVTCDTSQSCLLVPDQSRGCAQEPTPSPSRRHLLPGMRRTPSS